MNHNHNEPEKPHQETTNSKITYYPQDIKLIRKILCTKQQTKHDISIIKSNICNLLLHTPLKICNNLHISLNRTNKIHIH